MKNHSRFLNYIYFHSGSLKIKKSNGEFIDHYIIASNEPKLKAKY